MPFCPAEDEASSVTLLNSCVLFCDCFVSGNDSAVGLKFDEENMFVPIVVFSEKDAAADFLIQTAEISGIPVAVNALLAKNLSSCKPGEGVPEAYYREVSILFARLGANKRRHISLKSPAVKGRSGVSAKKTRSLSVELGVSVFSLAGEGRGLQALLAKPLEATRKKLMRLLGFPLPAFRIKLCEKLKPDEYRILFKGIEAGRGRMELGWYSAGDELFPAAMCPDIMNKRENIAAAAKAVTAAIVRHVNEIVSKRAAELLGRDEVQVILDRAEEKYPVVTGEVKSLLPLGIVREVLQGLVSEQVSIRHIDIILETLADWANLGTAPSELIIEQIRNALKRQICLEYADGKMTLRVLTLEQKIEDNFASVSESGSVSDKEAELEDAENSIAQAVAAMEEKGIPPVILCSPKARTQVKEATRLKFPSLAVLSYSEIPLDMKVVPEGVIRLKG